MRGRCTHMPNSECIISLNEKKPPLVRHVRSAQSTEKDVLLSQVLEEIYFFILTT